MNCVILTICNKYTYKIVDLNTECFNDKGQLLAHQFGNLARINRRF